MREASSSPEVLYSNALLRQGLLIAHSGICLNAALPELFRGRAIGEPMDMRQMDDEQLQSYRHICKINLDSRNPGSLAKYEKDSRQFAKLSKFMAGCALAFCAAAYQHSSDIDAAQQNGGVESQQTISKSEVALMSAQGGGFLTLLFAGVFAGFSRFHRNVAQNFTNSSYIYKSNQDAVEHEIEKRLARYHGMSFAEYRGLFY